MVFSEHFSWDFGIYQHSAHGTKVGEVATEWCFGENRVVNVEKAMQIPSPLQCYSI